MRVAIVGTRHYTNYKEFLGFLDAMAAKENVAITHVVSGGARGVDSLAERFAKQFAIPITIYPAKWHIYGKQAGMIRNNQIVDDCDIVFAFPSPASKGTKYTIDLAIAKGKPVLVRRVEPS